MPPTEPVFRLTLNTPAGGRLDILPVLHYKAEFAYWVHQAVSDTRYDDLAVELAPFLQEAYLKATLRLPMISILAHETRDQRTMLLPVEPTDPFSEAVRAAQHQGWGIHFVDRYLEGYENHHDPLPDSVTLAALGPEQWWNSVKDLLDLPPDPLDGPREEHMAAQVENLFRFRPQRQVLLVCGAWHALRLMKLLQEKLLSSELKLDLAQLTSGPSQPATPPAQVSIFHPDLSSLRQIACEIPYLSVLFEFHRQPQNLDQHPVWSPPPQDEVKSPPPPPNPLESLSSAEVLDSLNSLLGLRRPRRTPFKPANLKAVADYLNQLQEEPASLHHLLSQLSDPSAQPESLELPSPPHQNRCGPSPSSRWSIVVPN